MIKYSAEKVSDTFLVWFLWLASPRFLFLSCPGFLFCQKGVGHLFRLHVLTGFNFGICICIVSWMVGIMGGALLKKTSYFAALSHLNFIPSKRVNEAIGLKQFKWIVKNSFFRFLNQSIRVEGKHADVASIRYHMTVAELNHLIGFLFVALFALYQSFNVSFVFGLTMMIPNAVLNGYPALLQQENKRRLNRLLNRMSRHHDSTC